MNEAQKEIYDDPRKKTDDGQKSYLFDDIDQSEVKTHPVALALSVLFLIAGIALPIYFGYTFSEEGNELDTEIEKLEDDIEVLDQQIAIEKGRGEALNKELENKIALLTSPLYRVKWSEVLDELNNVIQKATGGRNTNRLFTFTSYTATETGRISVNGLTNTYSNIATLIEAIEDSKMFSDVSFTGSTKKINPDGQTVVTINLSFDLTQAKKANDLIDSLTGK